VPTLTDMLSCVVFGVGEPTLVDAVRSLVRQQPRPQVVVVSSGTAGAQRQLRAAGLDVPVIERADRVFPGAARNLGIRACDGSFVAFLEADCVAAPGWAAARLGLHRAGAPLVGHVWANATPASRSACASHLLLHHRLTPDTPEQARLHYGLSYERDLFERHGLFREDLRTWEDTELNERLYAAGVPVVSSPAIRTLHRYPTSPLALVRDQYVRGVRYSRALRRLGSRRSRFALARAPLRDLRPAVRQARRTADPVERARLMRALPLLPPAAAARALGALAGA
jgi:GT2 family glycosyltransferase